MKHRTRYVILALLILLIAALRFTPLGEQLSLERLAERRDALLAMVERNAFLTGLLFVLVYLAAVALSIPGATLLSLVGGFLFGPVLGVVLINLGATTGALLIFLAARFLFGESVQQKYPGRLERFNDEIARNGTNYLLTLRLIPIFPFFLINLFAGFTRIPAFTFIWTTAVGIIPGSFVYAYLGYTGTTIEPGESLLSPQIVTALVLLGLASLLPVIVRKVRGARNV
jgi:uncharacterized membrane protein YdjX (TVP38/TMEM64 family)